MPKAKAKHDAHIKIRGTGDALHARCEHCGSELLVKLPLDAEAISRRVKAFVREHERCELT